MDKEDVTCAIMTLSPTASLPSPRPVWCCFAQAFWLLPSLPRTEGFRWTPVRRPSLSTRVRAYCAPGWADGSADGSTLLTHCGHPEPQRHRQASPNRFRRNHFAKAAKTVRNDHWLASRSLINDGVDHVDACELDLSLRLQGSLTGDAQSGAFCRHCLTRSISEEHDPCLPKSSFCIWKR